MTALEVTWYVLVVVTLAGILTLALLEERRREERRREVEEPDPQPTHVRVVSHRWWL